MKIERVGLYIAIVIIALSVGSEFLTEQADNLQAVGISAPLQELLSGFLSKVATAVTSIAVFIGIAVPSLQRAAERKAEEETYGG